jgi:hypothetical protein
MCSKGGVGDGFDIFAHRGVGVDDLRMGEGMCLDYT